MKQLILIFSLFSIFGFSQRSSKPNSGIYLTTDVQFAPGLEKTVADLINENNNVPLNANFGATSVLGFQPIQKIGLGAGFRYNYFFESINNLYFLMQPKIFLGNDSESGFVYINAGFLVNKNKLQNSRFYGIGLGDENPISSRVSYFYTIFLENHRMNFGEGLKNNFYIGLSIGIGLHTIKSEK